jgi:hypothetical protein
MTFASSGWEDVLRVCQDRNFDQNFECGAAYRAQLLTGLGTVETETTVVGVHLGFSEPKYFAAPATCQSNDATREDGRRVGTRFQKFV